MIGQFSISKRIISLLVILVIINKVFCQTSKHIILVTIDGLRPEFYLSNEYAAPNLKLLMKEGSYAKEVMDVFPAVTYPNHTSIITGVLPAKHGIYCNEPFEPDSITGKWFWYADSIKAPTLWQVLHQHHLKTASVLWPVTVNADIDYDVPDIWDTKTYDRAAPIQQFIHPKDLWQELQQNATGVLTTDDLNEGRFSLDENSTRIAGYIIRTYKPALLALHLINVDDMQHEYGRDADSVQLVVANADHCIGQLLEAIDRAGIKDSTTIIITGDHGFMDIQQTIFPNVWLAKNGFINGKEWKAKFHSGRGSGFLRLYDPNDKTTLNSVKAMLNVLPDSVRNMFTIIEKEELQRLGAYSDAVLTIVPKDGISVGASSKGEAIRPAAQKGTHGYLPANPKMKTGFIVYGAGIRKGTVISEMSLLDIAPLIAKLLGIDFITSDGKLIQEIIKE